MKLLSGAFPGGGDIPRRFTCEGENLSPPLVIEEVPSRTQSLALVIDDPDAPDPRAPQRRWVHWVLYNLPSDTRSLPEGVHAIDLPRGTAEGLNDWNRVGYGGPCPPKGRHRYFHTLYALDTKLDPPPTPFTRDRLLAAMEGHVLAKAELMGTYQKAGRT
jgi:Raf kinase inhibitor-like YbhB/YbcL family protein